MRYPPEETAAKHRRLLEVASSMVRERGIDGVSVNDVMTAVGMTHGAFYAHFPSKDELASAALQEAMEQSDAMLTGVLAKPDTAKEAFVETYLSKAHRDDCGQGCPMPALAVEIGRRGRDKPKLTRHVRRLIGRMVKGFRWKRRGSKRDQAILMTSAMVGAVVLARSVDDRKLSDEILEATKRQLLLGRVDGIPAVRIGDFWRRPSVMHSGSVFVGADHADEDEGGDLEPGGGHLPPGVPATRPKGRG